MMDGHRRAVAVVDDDEAVRESLRFLLETAGYDVTTYNSACGFLSNPSATDAACLVVDQHMPRVTGLDLLSRLRERGAALPIALISGSLSPDLVSRAHELGAAVVLEKPLADDALLNFVQAVSR